MLLSGSRFVAGVVTVMATSGALTVSEVLLKVGVELPDHWVLAVIRTFVASAACGEADAVTEVTVTVSSTVMFPTVMLLFDNVTNVLSEVSVTVTFEAVLLPRLATLILKGVLEPAMSPVVGTTSTTTG